MKRHGRAIEKLLRSYGNAPARLLDVARSCLVLESVEDLCRCLGIIAADQDVRIERVKNRMHPEYNACCDSAGYRDVLINLCIQSRVARELGVDFHVCEVQLILLEFAQLKTRDGHKRYVRARNNRGA